MKIARYALGGAEHYGLLEGGVLRRLRGDPYGAIEQTGDTDKLASVRLLCPVESPRIFAVGMNYKSHIAEVNYKTPDFPMFYMKPSTAAAGPDENIVLPHEAKIVHHECELAVVIGKKARRLSEADALGAVLGYACSNDVSERVIQNAEMAMGALLIGKSFDSFCPIGPVIATDLDPTSLNISTHVNGEQRQNGNTADLLFSVAYLVSYVSQAITLLPGDVIITGTPGGVGPLVPGDVVEITIEGVGTLRNPVVAEGR